MGFCEKTYTEILTLLYQIEFLLCGLKIFKLSCFYFYV